nr:unnamed protein product [Digitaria exilis]
MPPPGKPYYTRSGAAGLSAPDAGGVDPDYKCFLDCVRLDGNSYALYIPSKDGVSPPEVIRYEEPFHDCNVGAPVAGSHAAGWRGAPPPLDEDSYGVAVPPRAGVKRKAPPHGNPRSEARRGAVPVEEEDPPAAQVPEPAWHDSHPDIDEDYGFFLRNVRVENDGKVVLKMGNSTVPIGHEPSVDNRGAEEEDDAEEEDEDESIPASGQSGENGVGTEKNVGADKEAGLYSELQVVHEIDLEVKEEKVSEEEEGDDEDTEEEEVDEDDVEWMSEEEMDSEVGPGCDLQIVNVMEFETKEEVEEERETPLSVPVKGMTESQPLNREASSSKGHPTIPLNDSELQGVVWPPHITERPDSDFKGKLMKILIKPFEQEEYNRYVAVATKRSPVVKERRTRHNVVYYPWKHEMGKSYFDSYPGLFV